MELTVNQKNELVEQYKLSCEICSTHPDPKYCMQFKKGELLLNISNLDSITIDVLCHSLSHPLTPVIIEVTSSNLENKVTDEKKMLLKVLKSLVVALKISKTLLHLRFINVHFLPTMVTILSQGLSASSRLRSLAFFSCDLKPTSVEAICSAIKNVACLTTLTFENCQIENKSLQFINSLVMHQCFNRRSLMWKDTLRSQHSKTEAMNGLRYLVLNNNPLLGDEGVRGLTESLADDLWMEGIEMKNCGITSESSEPILYLLKVNKILKVFSLKNNPFLQQDFFSKVEDVLKERSPPIKPPLIFTYLDKSLPKKKIEKRYQRVSIEETMKLKAKIPQKLKDLDPGVPWRIEGRLIERSEGLPVGTLNSIIEDIRKAKIRRKKYVEEEETDLGICIQNIRNVIRYYKSKWKAELRRRGQAEARVKRLERKLARYKEVLTKSYILDEETFLHVEECFNTFQNFLSKLRKVGYIGQNDFDEEFGDGAFKFSSIPLANQELRDRASKSDSGSRHSNASDKASKNSEKSTTHDSRASQTDFSATKKLKNVRRKSEILITSSNEKLKSEFDIGTEQVKIPENSDVKQMDENSDVESKTMSNSYSEKFETSVEKSNSSHRASVESGSDNSHTTFEENRNDSSKGSASSHDSGSNKTEKSQEVNLLSNQSEILEDDKSNASNSSKFKTTLNKTFTKDVEKDLEPSARDDDVNKEESSAKSDCDNNHFCNAKSGCKSIEADTAVTHPEEEIRNIYTDSEPSDEDNFSSLAMAPLRIKNIHPASVPVSKSMEDVSDTVSLHRMATDDEKLNKIVIDSSSRRNFCEDSAGLEDHIEITDMNDKQDTENNQNGAESISKLYIRDEQDTVTSNTADESCASPLVSLKNSRQPSLTSISEHLSIGHDKWLRRKFYTRKSKSDSMSEEYDTECEESNSRDVSAGVSLEPT